HYPLQYLNDRNLLGRGCGAVLQRYRCCDLEALDPFACIKFGLRSLFELEALPTDRDTRCFAWHGYCVSRYRALDISRLVSRCAHCPGSLHIDVWNRRSFTFRSL